jgi:hypothetical protein
MRIITGVGDLVQRTRDGCTDRVLGAWAIGRSGDVVCGLSLKTKVDSLSMGWHQNHWDNLSVV